MNQSLCVPEDIWWVCLKALAECHGKRGMAQGQIRLAFGISGTPAAGPTQVISELNWTDDKAAFGQRAACVKMHTLLFPYGPCFDLVPTGPSSSGKHHHSANARDPTGASQEGSLRSLASSVCCSHVT